jgi:hypothetical protein
MDPSPRSVEASPRAELLVAGICLSVGFVCAAVGAFYPGLSPVWPTGGSRAVALIADGRRGDWQVANWLFAVGIWFTLVGLATLTVLMLRRRTELALSGLAVTLVSVAATLWTIDLAYRLTVTVRIVDAATGGRAVPDWYSDLDSWAGIGLLNAAGLLGGTALILYGLAMRDGAVVPRWTGWFAAGFGLLLLAEVVLTGDTIPLMLYIAPLPAGIAALLRARRRAPVHADAT